MRTTTAPQDTALAAKERRVAYRLRAKNASGTWKTLTELGQDDLDFLDRVRIGETIDQPVPFGEFTLHKYHFDTGENLAPLDENSSLNVDDGGSYAALLDAGREIDFAIATVAHDTEPTSGDYETVFHGEVDAVAWPDETVNLTTRDYLASHLWDRWIEEPTTYGGTQDVEVVMQDILTAETDGRVTLWVPTSPGLAVPDREMGPMRVYDALIQLAQMTGWALRILWRESAGEFQLKFFEPSRSASTTDWDFSTDDYFVVRKAEISRENIRNAIDVKYTDSNGDRQTSSTTDGTSIARFGRRWMGLFLGADDPIDTAGEADTLRDAALADLKDPDFDFVVEADLFWPVQLDDYYGFTANNDGDERWFSTDQALGLYGYTHEIAMDRARTTLQTRGQPAGHYLRWHPWSEDTDIPPRRRARPTISFDVAPGTGSATVTVTVDDPDKLVSADVAFQTKTGSGAYNGSWLTSWDTSTGTAGSDETLTRAEAVDFASKHNAALKARVQWVDDDGAHEEIREVTFDSDQIAEVASIEIDFDENGQAVVSVTGDEDAVDVHVTVGDGTTPADPTIASNDGSAGARNGTIATGVKITTGNEAIVKVVAEDIGGNLGPVQTARSSRRIGLVHRDGSTRSHTGDTSSTVLETVTIPGGVLGTDGIIEVYAYFECGGTNSFTTRISFGSSTPISVTRNPGSSYDIALRLRIVNTGSASAQTSGGEAWSNDGFVTVQKTGPAEDTTTDTDIEISVQLGNSGDTVALLMSTVNLVGSL